MWTYTQRRESHQHVWWAGDSRAAELFERGDVLIRQLETARNDQAAERLDREIPDVQLQLEARRRRWHQRNGGCDFSGTAVALARHASNLPY